MIVNLLDSSGFDDVGKKTRHENRNLNRGSITNTWTPIKPVTTQFALGKTKSAQVVRKQFPLRPASAKTVHRSQGDTQSHVVVNLNTRRTIPQNEYKLDLCCTPLYMLANTDLKICYLNARSLHKHVEDVRKDINYLSADITIFTETRFSQNDPDEMYAVEGYELFRNDET